MNAAQLHLAINHFPVVLDVVAAVACGWGALRRSRAMQRHGLALAIVAAVAAVPTFLTGEPTAQLLGRDPALLAQIHEHEEAAEAAFALIGVAGASAALSLILFHRAHPKQRLAFGISLVLLLAATGFVVRAAHEGGLIRHPELHAEWQPAPLTPAPTPPEVTQHP